MTLAEPALFKVISVKLAGNRRIEAEPLAATPGMAPAQHWLVVGWWWGPLDALDASRATHPGEAANGKQPRVELP